MSVAARPRRRPREAVDSGYCRAAAAGVGAAPEDSAGNHCPGVSTRRDVPAVECVAIGLQRAPDLEEVRVLVKALA